ncbi:unnamed protein product, partial [Amoebophrya sp. A120]|eukprot:GSA120T00021216001.1
MEKRLVLTAVAPQLRGIVGELGIGMTMNNANRNINFLALTDRGTSTAYTSACFQWERKLRADFS